MQISNFQDQIEKKMLYHDLNFNFYFQISRIF
jgi:hypothetical protein